MDRLASLMLLLALGCRAQPSTQATSAGPTIAAAEAEAAAPVAATTPDAAPSAVVATPVAAAMPVEATPVAATTPDAAPSVVAATPVEATPVAATRPDAAPAAVAATSVAATPVVTTPAQPLQASAAWPFKKWDRAEAIRFNNVRPGPGIALRAYDAERGWSDKIVERRSISRAQAEQAVKWTSATGGEVEVSKCAFPRHAVVLYSGETPVGSVNLCFECGDILVWPDIDRPPDHANMKPGDAEKFERRYEQKLRAYKKVFPRWEKLFRDELGWPLDPL